VVDKLKKQETLQEVLKHDAYLYKRAYSLCKNDNDAKELVQETYLKVLIALNKGTIIENVKSYLLVTLKNNFLKPLKQKHVLQNSDQYEFDVEANELHFVEKENKKEIINAIRKELAFLPKMYREVLVQYYFEKKCVNEIASKMKLSISAVKSRLERGRIKIKEGVNRLDTLTLNSFHPDNIKLNVSGQFGMHNEPMSVISTLIDQNALVLAYDKPISVKSLSEKMGTAIIFIEEAVDKLVQNELMKREGSKVYTNFPIIDENFVHKLHEAQKKYVDSSFDTINKILSDLINEYRKRDYLNKFNETQLYLYVLYSIFTSIFFYLTDLLDLITIKNYPERINSGRWMIDFGYKRDINNKESFSISNFLYSRFITTGPKNIYLEFRSHVQVLSQSIQIHGLKLYDLGEHLYHISKGFKYNRVDYTYIPLLKDIGYIYTENDILKSNIPVINDDEYEELKILNHKYAMIYIDQLGDKLLEMIKTCQINHPKHVYPVSNRTQLIFLHDLALFHIKKASKDGIIDHKDPLYCPVAIIVEKIIK